MAVRRENPNAMWRSRGGVGTGDTRGNPQGVWITFLRKNREIFVIFLSQKTKNFYTYFENFKNSSTQKMSFPHGCGEQTNDVTPSGDEG